MGDVPVEIGGQTYTLRFDHAALDELQENVGDNPNLFDSKTVGLATAIGLKRHHPEMTTEKIREISPPLVPLAKAVQSAIQYAYFGTEPVPEESEKKADGQSAGGLWRRFVSLFSRASIPTHSGV